MFDAFPGWPEWMTEAKCAGDDVERYSTDNLDTGPGVQAKARALCAGCPVIRECAIDALRFDTRGVVRGGFAFSEDATKANRFRQTVAVKLGVVAPKRSVKVVTEASLRTHCVRGHELTFENTRIRSDGTRMCRECKRMWQVAENERRKARRAAKRQQQEAA